MPDYANAKQTSLSVLGEHERFIVNNPAEIRTQLLALARQPSIITAYFNDGKSYLLTAVLGVLHDRNLLVLDFGPDDEITRKAIADGRLVCTTKYDGVPIRFTCENLKSARYKALPAIAAAVPQSMFRQQRREFFRVTTPKFNGPVCEIPRTDSEEPYQLSVSDLSLGGIGLLDHTGQFLSEVDDRFENCRLLLPEYGEATTNIVIRNSSNVVTPTGEKISRHGAAIEGMSVGDNSNLQRYIFHLQTLQPK